MQGESVVSSSAVSALAPDERLLLIRSAGAVEAARLMADRHCEDVRILDVRGISQLCDYLIIGSGTSDRQMRALAEELDELGAGHGQALFRQSADPGHTWVVLDFVDVVVHLFEPGQRAYYDLDGLWSDAETVSWERERGKEARARA